MSSSFSRGNKRCDGGFGMIEALVALGFIGILTMAISGLFTRSFQTQRGVQAKDQQRDVTAQVRTLLTSKAACFESFKNLNPQSGFQVTSLKNGASQPVFTSGQKDASGFLEFGSFRVNNWRADAGAPQQGMADLLVLLTKTGAVQGARDVKPDVITLRIKRNPSGGIVECYSIGTKTDGYWQASPSNMSDIYYSEGKVGIEVSSPRTSLEAAGPIRPGSSGIAVDSSCYPEGALAYDMSLHTPVFCHRTGVWKPVGGGLQVTFRAGPTSSGGTSVASCLANEKLVSGGCNAVDNCSGNDSSIYGGYPDVGNNSWVCPGWHCNATTAYAGCAQ